VSSLLRVEYGESYEFVRSIRAVRPLGEAAEPLAMLARSLLQGAGTDRVMKAAVQCLAVTRRQHGDMDEVQVRLGVYAQQLQQFPADVVEYVFGYWSRNEDWWPTLRQILELCERHTRWRRDLLHATTGAK
jgi:hypothetical protein